MPDDARPNADQAAGAKPTGVLVLADGTVLWGRGLGAEGDAVGEVCFNTSMTGYQEILTDPSYSGQIITFTFPHVGNVGTNFEDIESVGPGACGLILRADITEPSSWRAASHLDAWAKQRGLIGLAGVDTRRLTRLIRAAGAPNGIIAHNAAGVFDLDALKAKAKAFPGLEGLDLAKQVFCRQTYTWDETLWSLGGGYGRQDNAQFHIVAIDYGVKRNILRCLANTGARVTVVPGDTSAEAVLALGPDGVFLSNGPGDPAATGEYAVPVIKALIETGKPVFGICLGHQMLALALGARTVKMKQGHRGANHPVKDKTTGKVEITSQNHGFVVLPETLPANAEETHVSLFDGTNEGLRMLDRPVFSVQYHPEASPGPEDSHYLFDRFIALVKSHA
nr:glutamine-hydrolyzing carbamoyl-phosphate synthase small subunit [Zavarzinia compransoris]